MEFFMAVFLKIISGKKTLKNVPTIKNFSKEKMKKKIQS
jgi:hypothetical protein